MINRHVLFVLLCIVFVVICGCAGYHYEHNTNYSDRKLILFVPIINLTDKKILKSDYYDGRRCLPIKITNRVFPAPDKVEDLRGDLHKNNYTIRYASVTDRKTYIAPSVIKRIVNRKYKQQIIPGNYAYVIVVTVDNVKRSMGMARREIELTTYLFDNQLGKIVNLVKNRDKIWRGAIQGPLEAILGEEVSPLFGVCSVTVGSLLWESSLLISK